MSNQTKTRRANTLDLVPSFRLLKIFILLGGMLLVGYALTAANTWRVETPAGIDPALLTENQELDYSRFAHTNQAHARLPCLICHRRDDNSARIGFPGKIGHLPCAGCHLVEFSSNTSPMCTICHTNTGMKRFPGLQSFGAKFDHSRHTRVNCAVCHKAAGRGVARSIPSGANAHVTCFQCHSATASNSMASCSVCHSPGRLVRTTDWAASFRKSFGHARHLGKNNMNCAVCHALSGAATRGKQMTSPLPSMHFAPERGLSCGGCHNGIRAFGPDDFANCQRCHGTKSFKF
jgi:c(7)-type cytochrome triheme protein